MQTPKYRPPVFESPAIKRVVEKVRRIAPFDIPVALTGETGVGKEVIARLIHDFSPRSEKEMVSVNCSAVPETLAESEFFGSVKGSYTGSIGDRTGYFKQAEGSTIFLDELPEMGFDIQSKLLVVLQNKRFRPVGGKEARADFRVVWATNRKIEEAIKEGKLRKDLYFRVNEAEIYIPPLRERREDILPLARYFLTEAVSDFGKKVESLSDRCKSRLLSLNWPGNVRQLRTAIRRAVIDCRGEDIDIENIEEGYVESVSVLGKLEQIEMRAIKDTLKEADGNKLKAAKLLGIGRQTLYNKLRRYEKGDGINGKRVNPSTLSPRQILEGDGELDFDMISQRGYSQLGILVMDAFAKGSQDPIKIARRLRTTPKRLVYVMQVFQLDELYHEFFGSRLSSPRGRKLLGYSPEGNGPVIDVELS